MSEWAVAGFVSRVADRVTLAGEVLAAQLVDPSHSDFDAVGLTSLASAFPYVEPSTEFIDLLGQQLRRAPLLVASNAPRTILADRRVVYGFAAVGSLASAAVVAMLFLRSRAANHPAA